MILMSLLLATAPVAAPADPAVEQDILVIGRKLETWTAKYSVRGSRMRCRTKKSSGDAEIDAIGCTAFRECTVQHLPRLTASDDRALERRVRLDMKAAIKRDLAACTRSRLDELIADLAERRSEARRGRNGSD